LFLCSTVELRAKRPLPPQVAGLIRHFLTHLITIDLDFGVGFGNQEVTFLS
jgi:hypothetical protein